MTRTFTPGTRDELVALTRQLRAAYDTIANPAPADEQLTVDTSGPVQAITVSDALYAAWERAYAPPRAAAPETTTPPARVETVAADEKPKRRRAPKKPTRTPDTRGA